MTKLKLAVVLFSCVFSASISHAQETRRKEQRRDAAAEIQSTTQRANQKFKAPKASPSSWQKLSDQQIARLFFPREKLYFKPSIEELPMLDPASLDGVNVYEIKRVVANLDNDPDSEMAVLISYSTGMCTFCVGRVIFAILDRQAGKVRLAWRTEGGEAFDNGGAKVSTIKIVKKDKFFALACYYDSSPLGTGSSYKKMQVIRWDGKRFAEIWSYDLEGYDGGNRGGIPHDYLAKVDFLDDNKGAKKIKVASIYMTWPHREEQRTQYKLDEEFAWDQKTQTYQPVKQHEAKYEKGQTCVSYGKNIPKDESQCYGETAYQRGSEYLRKLEYDQAILAFSEALQNDPRSANAYSERGHAYTLKRQYDKAIADFNEALKIDAKSADTYLRRGSAYLEQGRYDQAISDYTLALEINPRSPNPYYYRAKAYQRKGQYDEAIADYTKMFELTPGGPWNYIDRGSVYYEKSDYDRAISDYSKALGMTSSPLWAQYTRGLAYWKKGQYDQALNDLSAVVTHPNFTPEAYYYRGRVYMDKGDYHRAISDFDRATEINPKNTEVHFYTAQAYERAGLTSKAINTYKALIQNASSGTSPLVEHARARIVELEK